MSKKTFEIRPLTGSNTANAYTDKENPIYIATIETQDGRKTHELTVGKNTAWNSELRDQLAIKIEDTGGFDLHVFINSTAGKTFDLTLSEASELRIMLNLMHKSLPSLLEKYEAVRTVKKTEEI